VEWATGVSLDVFLAGITLQRSRRWPSLGLTCPACSLRSRRASWPTPSEPAWSGCSGGWSKSRRPRW